jgi:mRNA interferase HigB
MGPWHCHLHVVSHKAIRNFCEEHPQARTSMDPWYRVAKRATWSSFAGVKPTFNAADFVAPHVVFDLGGNKYRLIAEIHCARRVLFIRRIMTHKEYMKETWKS